MALVFTPVIAFFLGLAVVAVSGLALVIGMPAIMKFGKNRKAAHRAGLLMAGPS